MNAAPAESLSSGPVEGWPRRRWIFLIALAFAAHITFVFVFGTKTQITPRRVTKVFQLQLADSASELIALDDPTLFVLPHANNFANAVWLRTPVIATPNFRWTEPPRWLPLAVDNLGASFQQFMRTNLFAAQPFALDFKPVPQLAEPESPLTSALPQNSTMQIGGELAQRRLLNQVNVPSLPVNDVLAPSKVQALVDAAGNVASVVLLEMSGLESADAKALALARTARFAPAPQLTFGELIFNWHTIPAATTNSSANP